MELHDDVKKAIRRVPKRHREDAKQEALIALHLNASDGPEETVKAAVRAVLAFKMRMYRAEAGIGADGEMADDIIERTSRPQDRAANLLDEFTYREELCQAAREEERQEQDARREKRTEQRREQRRRKRRRRTRPATTEKKLSDCSA